MAKKKINIDKYASGLFLRTEEYADKVRQHYAAAVEELLKLSAKRHISPGETFSFADNKKLSESANIVLRGLYSAVYNEIKSGVAAEWQYANLSCDALIESIFGKGIMSDNHFAHWFSRNQDAMDAFFARKSAYGGMNLSQKVWKYTGELKTEMELALTLSMGEGEGASVISRKVRQYLQEPERLFRRIKTGTDANGEPLYKLSKAAKAYHPGRGVYRSSYKNAMRLTRTETNMAYRTADYTRWQQLPFVVGVRVKLSKNHNCIGVPKGQFYDICDELAGDYPKDFKLVGWHPQCRCFTEPILAEEDEFVAIQKRVLAGEDAPMSSQNIVRRPPEKFYKWIDKNRERMESSTHMPYWVQDNIDYVNGKKKARIKTEAEREAIRAKWTERAKNKIQKTKEDIQLEKLLGIERGEPMSFDDANEQRGNVEFIPRVIEVDGKRILNPKFTGANQIYHINCQSCVVANEMRRRGWNVTAFGNTKGSVPEKLSRQTELIWVDENGNTPKKSKAGGAYIVPGSYKIKNKTYSVMMSEFEDLTKEQGRYHISWGWKGCRCGHIITAERLEDGRLRVYDPQNGKIIDNFKAYAKDFSLRQGINVLRVDGLKVNLSLIDKVVYKHSKQSVIKNAVASTSSKIGNSNIKQLRDAVLENNLQSIGKDEFLSNIATNKFARTKYSLKKSLSHCYTQKEIEAFEYIWNNPHKLTYIKRSPFGEVKDLTKPKDIKNLEKKRERKVVAYNVYSFTYNNELYYIKTEVHLKGFEYLYSFTLDK